MRTKERIVADLGELEAALGAKFASRELLTRALTHRSLAHELASLELASLELASRPATEATPEPGDNERLEFLGDAVLGLVVAEALYAAHPEWHEGELTRVRAHLVSREHMAEVAVAIELGPHLRLSRGEERSGLRMKSTVLSNSMEAIIGALFLDGGLDPVRNFVRERVIGLAAEQLAQELRSGAALGNFKSALQEYLQSTQTGTPAYKVKRESGPDHRKRFLVEVRLREQDGEQDGQQGPPLAHGKGSTKKLAEQDAARHALELLKSDAAETGNVPPELETDEMQADGPGTREGEELSTE